ncbi:MAG: hypothetical protein EAY75_12415 [Bacteroidetes bacterium]|nr:MAG: hypothetical protein EAY75_12415 [Bacteroidota bacterium]
MPLQKSTITGIAAAFFMTAFFVACSKEKFTTKPQLFFKKVESYNVGRGQLIDITLEFTDKEGDLTDSIFIRSVTTRCPTSNSTVGYKLPEFDTSSRLKGEFRIIFENQTNNTGFLVFTGNRCNRPDTTMFSFWMRDRAKNMSDTISIDRPIIIRNN